MKRARLWKTTCLSCGLLLKKGLTGIKAFWGKVYVNKKYKRTPKIPIRQGVEDIEGVSYNFR